MKKELFDKNYFKTGNYVNYLSKSERYYKLSEEISELLSKLGYQSKSYKILDYGCAVGFLLDGLNKLGFTDLCGFDISSWATSEIKKKGYKILNIDSQKKEFDICFILDVLEHMTDEEIKFFFENIKSNIIIYRIPVSNNNGHSFVLDVSNKDKTHINCKEKKDWYNVFIKNGYSFNFKLNLTSIYDSEGVMCGIFFKNVQL